LNGTGNICYKILIDSKAFQGIKFLPVSEWGSDSETVYFQNGLMLQFSGTLLNMATLQFSYINIVAYIMNIELK
jgi:hypothetical protein